MDAMPFANERRGQLILLHADGERKRHSVAKIADVMANP
jgi:hypothetical protein